MALTLTEVSAPVRSLDRFGHHLARFWDIDFDSSYPLGGESLSPADLGFASDVGIVLVSPKGGYDFEYDYSNDKLKVLRKQEQPTTLTLTDDDSAASNGVAVYVVVDDVEQDIAHLEFVSPTDTDGTLDLGNGDSITIEDDDSAASNGTQLYADEDATTPLVADLSSEGEGRDVYVRTDAGAWVRVAHDGSASSNGVAAYFDEDAGTATDRLLFVSPTDTDGSQTVDAEIEPATDLSGLTNVRVLALGV